MHVFRGLNREQDKQPRRSEKENKAQLLGEFWRHIVRKRREKAGENAASCDDTARIATAFGGQFAQR